MHKQKKKMAWVRKSVMPGLVMGHEFCLLPVKKDPSTCKEWPTMCHKKRQPHHCEKMRKVAAFYLSLLALVARQCLAFLGHASLDGRFPRNRVLGLRTPLGANDQGSLDSSADVYRGANAEPSSTSSSSSPPLRKASRRPSPFKRATEVGSIVAGDILSPLIWSLTKDGLVNVDDWDAFWSRETTPGGRTNAERVVAAIEKLGPTYVKFGQALSTRPDVVPPPLAKALAVLQDSMQAFDSSIAYDILSAELVQTGALGVSEFYALVESMTAEPVAAASIGQVYKGFLPGYGPVAIKVQRPGIRDVVSEDAIMLRTIASWIESLPSLPGKQQKLVAAKLTDAVDEFMTRLFEELDYRNEVSNLKTFASLYSTRNGSSETVKVVVPEVLEFLCTEHVIVMEWIEGSKLSSAAADDESARVENLALVQLGIECTLLQLLDSGIMHADPHPANLIKVQTDQGVQLGYLDFGILSTVPESVRDGLVCAVAQLVFAKDVEAVANLFGELQLLPREVLEDAKERAELTDALNRTFLEVLQYPESDGLSTAVPVLRFDALLGSLSFLLTRFQFELPPYFLNNARALGTLEGLARTMDPTFNVLQVVYPFALNRLVDNPSISPVVEDTLQSLVRSPETGQYSRRRIMKLIDDSAIVTGYRRRKVLSDVVKTTGGRRLIRGVVSETVRNRLGDFKATIRQKKIKPKRF
jgi:predicted unusual protein kinase regulating ubiquinone biosynthesis (AarF/ABC1/UbiB family)